MSDCTKLRRLAVRILDHPDSLRGQRGIDLPAEISGAEIVGPDPVHHQSAVRIGGVGRRDRRGRIEADVDRTFGVSGESAAWSAIVIGTSVGKITGGPPRKSLATRRLLSVRTVRKLNPRSPGRSSGESGGSRISRIVCALP